MLVMMVRLLCNVLDYFNAGMIMPHLIPHLSHVAKNCILYFSIC